MKSRRQSWGTVDGVISARSFTTDVVLACRERDCDFDFEDSGESGVERASKRARRHVVATGHSVDVARTRIAIFEPES